MSSSVRYFVGICLAGIVMMLVTGCRHHNDDEFESTSEHTLLLYMVGDNNLTNIVDVNIKACFEALKGEQEPLNLVVYRDNRSSTNGKPQLYQMVLSGDGTTFETKFLKTWDDDHDSTDPAILREVVKTTFNTFKSDVKGICFWSHGNSWIPGYDYVSEKAPSRAATFFGEDMSHYMEIWEMRQALEESGYHLDYLLFDACHMGTAEVCYELRNCCDWIVAAESELPLAGLDYERFLPYLCRVQERSANKQTFTQALRTALRGVVKSSEESHQQGTLALLHTEGIEALHSAFWALRKQHPDVVSDMATRPYYWHTQMQSYGRALSGATYYYYNMAEYGEKLQGSLENEIAGVVDYAYNSGGWYSDSEPKDFNSDCGIACSIPEFFSTDKREELLNSAYRKTQWCVGSDLK